MFVRVVRFTDVDAERMAAMRSRIDEGDGPPPGVKAKSVEVIHDASQGTAVVIQRYESAEDMEEAARIFSAMDASDTPGTRASVDAGELLLERTMA
jgi:hypothetical protein